MNCSLEWLPQSSGVPYFTVPTLLFSHKSGFSLSYENVCNLKLQSTDVCQMDSGIDHWVLQLLGGTKQTGHSQLYIEFKSNEIMFLKILLQSLFVCISLSN